MSKASEAQWVVTERHSTGPSRLRFSHGALQVTVDKRTFMSSDWWVQCPSLNLDVILRASTAKEAKAEAVKLVEIRLKQLASDVRRLKKATSAE